MVITVAVVRVVQVALHQVVDMVAMRDRFMSTAFPMNVTGIVSRTGVTRCALVRVGFADLEYVLVNVARMRRMQVAIVEIVDVTVVQDGSVTTAGAMRMIMIFVNRVTHSSVLPFGSAGDSLACANALNTRSTMCWSARA